MTNFTDNTVKALGLSKGPFPRIKNLKPKKLFAQPFEDLRTQLVQWVEQARPQYAQRQDFDPEQLGFEWYDVGGSADVYVSPCKRFAIRVTREAWDYAYHEFANIAEQRQNNPFYPKVYAKLQHDDCQVVLMEFLHEIDKSSAEFDLVETLREDIRVGKTGLKCPHAQELVRDLHNIIKKGVCKLDLSHGNALLRHTATGVQVVITDPIA